MPTGETRAISIKVSPIVRAIARVMHETTGEVRVHISHGPIERDTFGCAQKVFNAFGMHRTRDRNAVLIYINLKRRRLAILGDTGIHQHVGQAYWDELARGLREDLLSTHYENAIAIAVRTLGATLNRYYPPDSPEPAPKS